MDRLLPLKIRYGFLILFVLGFIFKPAKILHAQSPSPSDKYEQELRQITDQFNQLGFNITPYISDKRFEIYDWIDDRFINSAEKTSPTLEEYKNILGFEEKAAMVKDFMAAHWQTLSEAEEKYGINKFIIAAILGVESNFGETVGEHNPFNVYVSMMALDYRADFARAQLRHLLIFAERENINIMKLKSSYAGAMGYAQFIPYSINKWWVGNDLYSMKNNIYSVANYLAYFKERTGDIESAVLRYNPSSLYVMAVMDLAKIVQKGFTAAQ